MSDEKKYDTTTPYTPEEIERARKEWTKDYVGFPGMARMGADILRLIATIDAANERAREAEAGLLARQVRLYRMYAALSAVCGANDFAAAKDIAGYALADDEYTAKADAEKEYAELPTEPQDEAEVSRG